MALPAPSQMFESPADGAAIKARLRQTFRHLRDPLDCDALSQQLCNRLAAWPMLQQAQTLLAYWPHSSELSLLALMELWYSKTWGLPRCLPAGQLAWHTFSPQRDRDRLVSGVYGILEPPASQPDIELASVDAILVPALACDRWGTRLGYGGGYYDRLLSKPVLRQCLTVGIVTHEGFADAPLPREAWDVPMKAIATPQATTIAIPH